MNLIDQVKSIPEGALRIFEWLGASATTVSQEEAQARADICLKCPKNVSELAIAMPVAVALKKVIAMKNRVKLRVKGERELGLCDVCGCAIRLQVWQPMPLVQSQLTEEEKQQLAIPCWKRTST